MMHLMKIELQKFKLAKNIIISVLTILFCCLFISVSLVDNASSADHAKYSFESTFYLIGLLESCVFFIFSAVSYASFVIDEYNKKTILILFSYPVSKKKLIVSKIMIILSFQILAMVVGYVVCCTYAVWIGTIFDLMDNPFQISFLADWIPMAVVNIISCSLLSLWSFAAGMIRKSVPVTIVSSVGLILLRQAVVTKSEVRIENIGQVLIVLVITAIFLVLTFRKKVTDIE